MKKLLTIVVLGLLWNETVYADLTLYCKQEIRILTDDNGNEKTIPMKGDWKIIITDTEIKIPDFSAMYKNLKRSFFSESRYSATDEIRYYENSSKILFASSITISRITGEGTVSQIIAGNLSQEIIKCSEKKPQLLF
jgi:hypothetical protein